MAQQVTGARILVLEEHCRRRLDRRYEALLEQGFDENANCRGRVAATAAEAALYDHIERALELWQRPRWRPGGAA